MPHAAHSTTTKPRGRGRAAKPFSKPYPEYPLTPHCSGYWRKKINKRVYYFGKWAEKVGGQLVPLPNDGEWVAAKAEYDSRIHDIQAGREGRQRRVASGTDVITLADVFNAFLIAREKHMEAGDITKATFQDLHDCTTIMAEKFRKTLPVTSLSPADFSDLRAEFSRRWGPNRVGKFVRLTKQVFKWASQSGLCSVPSYGPDFKEPTKTVKRKHKATSDAKHFEIDEVRLILAALSGEEVEVTGKKKVKLPVGVKQKQLHAMVLVALNGAIGNTDCNELLNRHLDLKGGWLNFPRPKTGVKRRIPLWPETIKALEDYIAVRPAANDPANSRNVFLSTTGTRLITDAIGSTGRYFKKDLIVEWFRELLETLGLKTSKGRGFYGLRHTFLTIALNQSIDTLAIKSIAGHVLDNDITQNYNGGAIEDSRLTVVVQHVRKKIL